MAEHTVKLSKDAHLPVGKADVRFDIADEKGKLGTLLISKGGTKWRPYKKQSRQCRGLSSIRLMRRHCGDEKKSAPES